MASNVTYFCPVCGAEIFWNGEYGCFKCEYCDGEFQKEQLRVKNASSLTNSEDVQHAEVIAEEDAKYFSTDDGTEGTKLVKYKCSYCHSELITEASTAATICVYCGKPVVVAEQVVGGFAPKYVLPFVKTQKEAMDAFSNFMKKPLTPKDFKDSVTVDKVQGIYIPFWLFNGKYHADMEFIGSDLKKQTMAMETDKVKRTWKNFRCKRKGVAYFENVLADGSSKTDDDAMHSIEPFELDKMVPFDAAYLSGYLAERYDEESNEQKPKIEKMIENAAYDAIIQTVKHDRAECEYDNGNIEFSGADYALLPTWLLYCTYNNKRYLFAMNGQTGKFIGNLPIDWKKAGAIFAGLFAILALAFWIIL